MAIRYRQAMRERRPDELSPPGPLKFNRKQGEAMIGKFLCFIWTVMAVVAIAALPLVGHYVFICGPEWLQNDKGPLIGSCMLIGVALAASVICAIVTICDGWE